MFYSILRFKKDDKEMSVTLIAEGAGGVLEVQWGEGEKSWRERLEKAFDEVGLWQEYEYAAEEFAMENQIELKTEHRGQLAIDQVGT